MVQKRGAYWFWCMASSHARHTIDRRRLWSMAEYVASVCVDRWRHTSVCIGVLCGSNLNGVRREFYRSSVCAMDRPRNGSVWWRPRHLISLHIYASSYICRTRNTGSARKHLIDTHTTTNKRVAHIIGIRHFVYVRAPTKTANRERKKRKIIGCRLFGDETATGKHSTAGGSIDDEYGHGGPEAYKK